MTRRSPPPLETARGAMQADAAAAAWQLRLLGAPAAVSPDGVVHLLNAGDAALLAWLALQGSADRRRLAALLWPEAAPYAALNNLRQRIFKLHRLAPVGLLADGHPLALAAGVGHDVGTPQAALSADPRALGGALLGDHVYDNRHELGAWVAARRTDWAERVRDALAGLASQRESEGRIAEALAYASRLVGEQPLHEHGVRLLMRLHHRRGDRGAALRAFDDCVQALHDELGEAVSDETIALAQAIGRGSVQGLQPMAPLPLGLRHPPLTVGRGELIAAARQRWDTSGSVLLLGPAGIGKTRLFDELAAGLGIEVVVRLQPDDGVVALTLARRLAAAVLAARAPSDGADAPVVADAVKWLAEPASHRPPPGAISGDRLAQWLADAFDKTQTGALAIDNLHCADSESLAMLQRLLPAAGAPGQRRWLLAARSGELAPELAAWAAAGADGPAIDVGPLSTAAVGQLLASLDLAPLDPQRWAPPLHAHCGGHPLHLLQLLRTLHERGGLATAGPPTDLPVPDAALRSVRRWLDASPPQTQQLAFVAALAGADFDADLAAAVLGCRPAALTVPWRQLRELGVLRGTAFSHELIRQAVLDALPPPLAPALRRDIAEAMAARGLSPARRALHLEAAQRWAQAAADHLLVSEQSLQFGLQRRAVEALRAAAAAFDKAGDTAAAFEARWRAGGLALASESAHQARDDAQALVEQAGDDRQRSLAWGLVAQVRSELHDATALDAAALAMAHAEATGDALLLARAQLRQAGALRVAGQPARALQALHEVEGRGAALLREEQLDLNDALATTLALLGRRREALARSEAGLRQALAEGDQALAAIHAGNRAIQLSYLLRLPEAAQASEQAIALGRETGTDRGFLLLDQMGLAGLYQDLGQYRRALALAQSTVAALKAGGYGGWALNAENGLAGLFMVLGALDRAQDCLSEPADDTPAWTRAARWATRARLEKERGRPPLPWLNKARALLRGGGQLVDGYVRHRVDIELARAVEPAAALPLIRAARDWAGSHEHPALARAAAIAEVETRLRAGDAAGAAALAAEVEAQVAGDAGGQWLAYNAYLPEHWWLLARAWQAAGDGRRAGRLVRHATGWIAERLAHDVPPEFRAGFQRSRVNRALLEWAAGLQPAGR